MYSQFFTISQNLKSMDSLLSNSILIKIYNQNGHVKQSTHKSTVLAFFIMRRNWKQIEFLITGDSLNKLSYPEKE